MQWSIVHFLLVAVKSSIILRDEVRINKIQKNQLVCTNLVCSLESVFIISSFTSLGTGGQLTSKALEHQLHVIGKKKSSI